MSKGDFEVMPNGTAAEVTAFRKFANDLSALLSSSASVSRYEQKVLEIQEFYQNHLERYP